MQVNWPRFVELIGVKQRILVTSHIRPDCDALGSELAMAAILRKLGKDVRIVNVQETPPVYRFLDPAAHIEKLGVDVPQAWIDGVDLILVLDTSAWAQLGDMSDVIRQSKADKAVLDHHVSGDDLGAEWFKNTTAEATGRLVFEAAGHLGVEITPDMATALFTAIATDTGWFRFSSVTAGTYRLIAQLVDAGANPDAIYQSLYEQESLARLQLTGRVMGRVESELDGRLVYTWIERADFDAVGALASDSEDMINQTLTVNGTQVAVILVEQKSGGFKISFRSQCDVDCAEVAQQFGGGGHKKAAGAFIGEPLEVARSKVLDAVRAAMG